MPKLTSSKFKTGRREKPITPTITRVSPNPFTGQSNTHFEIEGVDFPQDATPYLVNSSGTEYPLTLILKDTIFPSSEYTFPGTYTWICPENVTSVSAVVIGAGGAGTISDQWGGVGSGGGGGGLAWKNNIPVTPGQSYTVVVGAGGGGNGGDSYFIDTNTVRGHGGTVRNSGGGLGGSYTVSGTNSGGGSGGNGSGSLTSGATGQRAGGGAGGYSGDGGAGSSTGTAGTGGAGGGGSQDLAGGGVRLYGQYASGAAGGKGGSYGDNGAGNNGWGVGGTGGNFGGGGAGGYVNNGNWGERGGYGAGGAARIVWGTTDPFPSLPTDIPTQKGFRGYTTRTWLATDSPIIARVKSATKTINSSFAIGTGNAPVWQTEAGSIGSQLYTQSAFSYTLVATDVDTGTVLTYSIISGSLPTGLTLNSSSGLISGNIVAIPNDTTYTFTVRVSDQLGNISTREFSIFKQGSPNFAADYLVVGGGGAGGAGPVPYTGQFEFGGGGGGAGGYLSGSLSLLIGSSYTISVGAGGTRVLGGTQSNNGGSSSLSGPNISITASGGGGGGATGFSWFSGANGASGGGNGGNMWTNASGTTMQNGEPRPTTTGQGITGQGNNGGFENSSSPGGASGGGGGGGANTVGGNAGFSGGGGAGGSGKQWLNGNYYAGGGGGSGSGTGGIGGGGADGTAGTPNTGGGGGSNRAGGSGVVIIRYAGSQRFSGGTITSANGFTYHTFTTVGSDSITVS